MGQATSSFEAVDRVLKAELRQEMARIRTKFEEDRTRTTTEQACLSDFVHIVIAAFSGLEASLDKFANQLNNIGFWLQGVEQAQLAEVAIVGGLQLAVSDLQRRALDASQTQMSTENAHCGCLDSAHNVVADQDDPPTGEPDQVTTELIVGSDSPQSGGAWVLLE